MRSATCDRCWFIGRGRQPVARQALGVRDGPETVSTVNLTERFSKDRFFKVDQGLGTGDNLLSLAYDRRIQPYLHTVHMCLLRIFSQTSQILLLLLSS